MYTTIISIIATALYFVVGGLLGVRLYRGGAARDGKSGLIALGMGAVALHGAALYHTMLTAQGWNFGFSNAASLVAGLVAFLLMLAAITKPVENLGIVILPLAGVALVFEHFFPGSHMLAPNEASELKIHILLSVLAYSLLSIAAVQAVLLDIQDRHLHNQHPGGFIRALPPLQTMETLLFQIIGLGFILLSLSLVSGAIFLEDIFAQHLAHKTVLSIIAWFVFATLLWGRRVFGWRGRTAIRWTISGFVVLMLAYFGSKLVLELLLNR